MKSTRVPAPTYNPPAIFPARAAEPAPAPVEQRPTPPDHDLIAARAYRLWTEAGCPSGQELDHWLAAERQTRAPH